MWLDDVVDCAHQVLLREECAGPARAYLRDRGVSDAQILRYRLGFWDSPPQVSSCSSEFWDWSRRNGFNRITFPLTDPFGTVTGLQVRDLSGKGYQNFGLQPRELYPMTFGLHLALPEMFARQRVVLVEGVFDFFAVLPFAPDVLCTLTSNVNLNIRRLLSRYCVLAVCLYDMDPPGRRGAFRLAGLEVPQEYRKPEDVTRQKPRTPPCSVQIPSFSEHDPDDLRRVGKLDELRRLVSAQPLVTRFAQLT